MAEKHKENNKIRVEYDEVEGWSIPAADLEKLLDKKEVAKIPVVNKKDIPTKKFIMGIAILVTVLAFGVLVPASRIFLAYLALFGFSGFLYWMNEK